jgi:hypothetical protein
MAKRKRRKWRLKGLGVLRAGYGRDLIPPVVGLGLTAGTTLAIRATVRPSPGTPSEMLYRFAPFIGMGVGVLGGVAVGILGSGSQAASAVMTSLITGGIIYGVEQLNVRKPGAMAALVGASAAMPAEGTAGLRAIVPEYPNSAFATRGLGAIVMERLKGNQQNQGADIQLRGVVNTGAFGSSPYGG